MSVCNQDINGKKVNFGLFSVMYQMKSLINRMLYTFASLKVLKSAKSVSLKVLSSQ